MRFISIAGHAGSGKDTTGEIIRKYLWGFGERVLITHYADLVKFMCRNYFDWDGQKDEAGRSLLQYVGTNKVRAKDPDYWVSFIADIAWLFPDEWDYVILPDCRFANEVEYLRRCGHKVTFIEVKRPGAEDHLTQEQRNHPSETGVEGLAPDFTIVNDGTLADLTGKVIEIIKPLRELDEVFRNKTEFHPKET